MLSDERCNCYNNNGVGWHVSSLRRSSVSSQRILCVLYFWNFVCRRLFIWELSLECFGNLNNGCLNKTLTTVLLTDAHLPSSCHIMYLWLLIIAILILNCHCLTFYCPIHLSLSFNNRVINWPYAFCFNRLPYFVFTPLHFLSSSSITRILFTNLSITWCWLAFPPHPYVHWTSVIKIYQSTWNLLPSRASTMLDWSSTRFQTLSSKNRNKNWKH